MHWWVLKKGFIKSVCTFSPLYNYKLFGRGRVFHVFGSFCHYSWFFFFPSHRSQLPLPPPTKTPNKYFFVCSGCERSVSSNHSHAVTTVTCDTKHYAAENEFYINVFSCKFLRLEGSIFSCPLGKKRAFILPKKQSN